METAIRHSVIIPVFNEEAVVNETYRRLTKVMESIGEPYELLFINDGSRDRTAEIIETITVEDNHVKLLNFSRNFGHQIAITAGMDYALGDTIIIIDADLQDPPELIPQMVEKWKEGYEVIYAKRIKRKGESLFKKWSAALFYRTLRASTEVNIPVDTGDFRLMDRKVCEAMRSIREKNRFVRGLVSWVGFRQTAIEYVRDERFAGETKYPLKKMIRLSMNGILSFSYKPLKLAMYLGFLISFASFVALVVTLYLKLFTANTIPGWTSIMDCLLLLNGITLTILGILGEYVGRIYDETKNRPLYILRSQKNVHQPQVSEGER
ncbi:glycosyltransferase family 2 protein [Aneurinibacillus sp. Ricciae_BoGa-3]|uniref:glycosyltransferase family 2 protein n=1 Tax=Aneurinibacillus sp. Ricciae_BoGa-3 TaxID=3022697 RepID=UPI00233FB051|nr:glycosyltransferase family 2 protein [Aneurinibacillus sp. Ricciae_BoGa-3]WCK54556.1 glycosyltransferase family 2 protein [Aneurinibacillus sp. Ricciae_BoGa-3]